MLYCKIEVKKLPQKNMGKNKATYVICAYKIIKYVLLVGINAIF